TPGWLHLIADKNKKDNNLAFDYSASKKLASGIYVVKVTVAAPGYNSQQALYQLRVVDDSKPFVVAANPLNGSTAVSINTSSIAANNLS
ncbi:hypothetical protein ABTO49_21045, partial [Acinetobacter baumannii]